MPTYRVRHTYAVAGWTETDVEARDIEEARALAEEHDPLVALPPRLTRHLEELSSEIEDVEEIRSR